MMNAARSIPSAVEPKPADPRLHQILKRIEMATERSHDLTRDLQLKADAIVGSEPVGEGESSKGAQPAVNAAYNGMLDAIEGALESLDRALGGVSRAERRFNGLA